MAEQLVYEIGDPANYVMPDVTCDWRGVRLAADDTTADTVHVSGAVGKPPPPHYKVGMTAFEGRIWLAGLTVFFFWRGGWVPSSTHHQQRQYASATIACSHLLLHNTTCACAHTVQA